MERLLGEGSPKRCKNSDLGRQSASRNLPDARLGGDECDEDGGADSDALAYAHCGQFTARDQAL